MAMITYDEVYDRIRSLTELATLARSLSGIVGATRDASRTAKEVAAIISKDPALSAKILKTVNSCFYGFSREVDTLEDAVVRLGFSEVERLCLAISVINHFGGRRRGAQSLNQLWLHSLVCGIAAETLVDVYRVRTAESPDVYYMGALLHDLGKAAIWQAFPDAAAEIRRLMETRGVRAYEAEQEILGGASHCEIGAWASEQWNLPLSIVQSIQMHHTPKEVPGDNTFVKVIAIADAVCYEVGVPPIKLSNGTFPAHGAPSGLAQNEAFMKRFRERYEAKRTMLETIAK